MNTEFEEFKDEAIAEIRANIHKYPSVCKMLLGKVDRLEAEVNALRSTPPPRSSWAGRKKPWLTQPKTSAKKQHPCHANGSLASQLMR